MVLDEGHSIESQFVGHLGLSLSRKILRKYIQTDILESISYNYIDDIKQKWLVLLIDIYKKISLAVREITSEEIRLDGVNYLNKIGNVIDGIKYNPSNWIVSKIEKENNKVIEVEFKPLDISDYCKRLFDKCDRIMIMSATILDIDTFCKSLGLDLTSVKFIRVDSDFPVENRPIYQINTAYLNYTKLQLENIQREISRAVDDIMTIHANQKGIIHCTSYTQVHFIEKYISME